MKAVYDVLVVVLIFLGGLAWVPNFFISAISITNTAYMANDTKQNGPLLGNVQTLHAFVGSHTSCDLVR